MKLERSCFNWGVSKNLLKRFWVLWAGYLAALLIALPVVLMNSIGDDLDSQVLFSGIQTVILSFFAGPAAAMAVFSFLYSPRGSGMMASLPLRRETLFLTAWLTGLLPLLLADLLTALLTAALALPLGVVSAGALLQWLAIAALGNLAFYGFAVFCAQLTGSALVLPALYVVLNLTETVVETLARELLETFVYGVRFPSLTLAQWLCPPVKLSALLDVDQGAVTGWGALGAYAAAGLLLSALALLLFRRRRMESAGDTVAIPALRPLFRWCMAFGTALVWAAFICCLMTGGRLPGMGQALFVLSQLLIGSFLGWFAAEMLIQRTLRVFRGRWRGWFCVAALLAALTLSYEWDLFGIERAVPDPAEVSAVSLEHYYYYRGEELTEPENIEKAAQLHRLILENRAENEDIDGVPVWLEYRLKNGRTVRRLYSVPAGLEDWQDPDSELARYQALMNAPEMLRQRCALEQPLTPELLDRVVITAYYTEDGSWRMDDVQLTGEEALAFLKNCLEPDVAAGAVNRAYLSYDDVPGCGGREQSNVTVRLEYGFYDEYGLEWTEASFDLAMDASASLNWVRENTRLEVLTAAEGDNTKAAMQGASFPDRAIS